MTFAPLSNANFSFLAQESGEVDYTFVDYRHCRTIDEAFKPNGITDNRNEWVIKDINRKYPDLTYQAKKYLFNQRKYFNPDA